MNKRDKAILESLNQFRVLDRDQLIQIHFGDVKDSVSSCNKVLKRLQRDGHVLCDPTRRPYLYFPNPSTLKKDSGKLSHFKAIADFYIEASEIGKVREFEVEIKLGEKGTVEPDMFMVWNQTPFFVEVENSVHTNKQMNKKMERYVDYFYSDKWKELSWQLKEKKFFPYVVIVADQTHKLNPVPFKLFQVKSMKEFHDLHFPKKKSLPQPITPSQAPSISIKIGRS